VVEDVPKRKRHRIPSILQDVDEFMDNEFERVPPDWFQKPATLNDVNSVPQCQPAETSSRNDPPERNAAPQPESNPAQIADGKMLRNPVAEVLRQ